MDDKQNPNPDSFTPPEPGPYTPDFKTPEIPEREGNLPIDPTKPPQEVQEHVEEVKEVVAKDKKQSKKLAWITAFLSLVVLIAVGAGVFLLTNSQDSAIIDEELTTDEILVKDLNTFAAGVQRYNDRNDEPLTITPNDIGRFKVSYVPTDFKDPRTGEPYVVTNAIPGEGELQYILGGLCQDDDSISQSGNFSNFATRTLLGTGLLHCIDSTEVSLPTQPSV